MQKENANRVEHVFALAIGTAIAPVERILNASAHFRAAQHCVHGVLDLGAAGLAAAGNDAYHLCGWSVG